MSKLYLEYKKRKDIDNSKYYLFKSGMFYIFIDEDAKNISNITALNLTNLNKDIVKCGFPYNCLEKYMRIFNNLGLEIVIIDNVFISDNKDVNDKVIKKIKSINIDKLTPIKALIILNDLKEMLTNE